MAKPKPAPVPALDAPRAIPDVIKKRLTFTQKSKMEMKQSFLDQFAEYGTSYHTCRAVGLPLSTLYDWLNADEDFAEAFKQVQRIPGYFVERAALKRARDERSNADVLRIFFLKNLLRDKYGEADRLSIEIKVQEILVSGFVSLVQQNIPNFCPHCKTELNLSKKLAGELVAMSERMSKSGGLTHAIPNDRTEETV